MKTKITNNNLEKKEVSRSFDIQSIIPFLGLTLVVVLFAVLTGGKNLSFSNIQRIVLQSVLLMVGSVGAACDSGYDHRAVVQGKLALLKQHLHLARRRHRLFGADRRGAAALAFPTLNLFVRVRRPARVYYQLQSIVE